MGLLQNNVIESTERLYSPNKYSFGLNTMTMLYD